jgi:hypothetical protein
MARAINRGYTDAKMTAFINWPLVASIPPGLPWETTGLMVADSPWSGAYSVGSSTWVAAQTTQFTQPGWTYIDSASGYLGGTESNGTYVSLKSPGGDYSTIIETTTATKPQVVNVTVSGGLSTGTVQVWTTNLNSANSSDYFVHSADITPTRGSYSLTLQPGFVYTLTTTAGAGKATGAGPPSAPFGLPYADNFDGDAVGHEAAYLADQDGSFEIQRCGGGRAGKCVQQMATVVPIEWGKHAGTPYTLIGDNSWADYTATSDVMFQQPGSVEVLARFEARDYFQIGHINAYYLRVDNAGNWSILKGDISGNLVTLVTGRVLPLDIGRWNTIALKLRGARMTAIIDGVAVGTAQDTSFPYGPAGLAVGVGDQGTGWLGAQFDNLVVR